MVNIWRSYRNFLTHWLTFRNFTIQKDFIICTYDNRLFSLLVEKSTETNSADLIMIYFGFSFKAMGNHINFVIRSLIASLCLSHFQFLKIDKSMSCLIIWHFNCFFFQNWLIDMYAYFRRGNAHYGSEDQYFIYFSLVKHIECALLYDVTRYFVHLTFIYFFMFLLSFWLDVLCLIVRSPHNYCLLKPSMSWKLFGLVLW